MDNPGFVFIGLIYLLAELFFFELTAQYIWYIAPIMAIKTNAENNIIDIKSACDFSTP